MTAAPWFFSPGLKDQPAALDLTTDESRHLAGSRRLRVGDHVTVFDGAGTTAAGRVMSIKDRPPKVGLELTDYLHVSEYLPRIHLMSAVPKGDRQSILLDMATQLGISDYTPLSCLRSTVKPGENAAARWERIMIEACKQCHRAWIPKIHSSESVETIANREQSARQIVLVADLAGGPVAELTAGDLDEVVLLVGPDGGFGSAEINQLQVAGATMVTLGSGNLRTETAAVAILSNTQSVLRAGS